MQFYHLAQRIFNVPVAIHPQKSEIIVAALADRLGISKFTRADGSVIVAAGNDYNPARRDEDHGYTDTKGFAIIPIYGTLVNGLGQLRPYSGMTGYDGIRQNFLHAINNDDIKGIILDIDSPGGEVSGCFDLVDEIYNARDAKPIVAILNESAYSAAYAIASAAHRITVPRTGGTGSVGVICMHVDYSEALGEAGIKVTLIQYGKHKADYAEVRPLSEEALARLQGDINTMGELFVETVARNRALSVKEVRATEAACFLGQSGVDVGFADEVIAPAQEFSNLVSTSR